MALSGRLRKRLFGISPEETTFARRGFPPVDPRVQQRLERIGRTFVEGYHLALDEPDAATLGGRLDEVDASWRGFAYEGAAMGLALFDAITPWRGRRLDALLAGPGQTHVYMVHVGAGWAAARLPWLRRNLHRYLTRFDPLLRWLIVDGYGFHEGYFHWRQSVAEHAVPRRLTGYARRVFDQGLGRSLWFGTGADVSRVGETIAGFPSSRHADLYGGVGLACAYAGGVDREAIENLREAAGHCRPSLAQGAAFGTKARLRAAALTQHTELACELLCGMSADEAAAVTDTCLADLPGSDYARDDNARDDNAPDGEKLPAYELWRQRIQSQITGSTATGGSMQGHPVIEKTAASRRMPL